MRCLILGIATLDHIRSLEYSQQITMATMSNELQFVRGKNANSIHAIYRGYRYRKDGNKLLASGYQNHRCVISGCKGLIHTLDNTDVLVRHEHNHEPDISECEAKIALSHSKDMAVNTRTDPAVIIADCTDKLSLSVRMKLPSHAACKKQIQVVRAREFDRPRAPKTVQEIQIVPEDCITGSGQKMLLHDNGHPENRLLIFGTPECVRLMEESKSW